MKKKLARSTRFNLMSLVIIIAVWFMVYSDSVLAQDAAKQTSVSETSKIQEGSTEAQSPVTRPNKGKQPVLIQSRVQGSQEQPKVIYIMPWQDTSTPILIDEKTLDITMPTFKPLNPKQFKQQVNQFYQLQSKTQAQDKN
ncbi:hypothetical protein [Saccharobesus litoralis]|uniref:hypothetical protein n=1 Tax=Saccharobesus litoralis TaxID=2172099 RepID=UPI00131F1C55|nr:hypothetical protein [Saccharobesus litoralis]